VPCPFEVRRLVPALEADLLRFLGDPGCRGWCFCVAWWVPTWDGWGDRTAAENRALREDLLRRGEHDGYLLYSGGEPVGWCQCGPRDRLPKLVRSYGLEPDPGAWAVSCFEIEPAHRGRGAARALLRGALEDLRSRGVRRVEGFPRRGEGLEPGRAWTGPEALFAGAGFRLLREAERGPVYGIDLA